MRTVTFQSVLWGAARKSGLFPELDGLDLPIAAQLTEGINDAIKLAWEYFDWPELTRTLSFNVQDHPTAIGAKYLPYLDPAGTDQFGSVLGMWATDPRLPRACRVPYELLDDGVYLPADTLGTVWMQFRGAHPSFTHATYVARQYLPGEVIYLPADGECYRRLPIVLVDINTGLNITPPNPTPPPPNPVLWEKVPFPRWLATACAHGAAAALIRGEGQGGSALTLEAIMIEWLDHEIDQIFLQQQQGKAYRR